MKKNSDGDIVAVFKAYAESFCKPDVQGGFDEYILRNIKLKIDHTMRVTEIAVAIAEAESFSPEDIEKARLCALFHDIGRFRQFAVYRTFSDARSVNHAQLGAQILESSEMLADMDSALRRLIVTSTRMHNMQNIPDNIDGESRRFVNIVRDADKIDILEIFCEYLPVRDTDRNDALELGLPETDEYNPEIIERIYRGETIPNSLRQSTTDMRIIHVAWVLDLNYRASCAEIIRRRTIERLSHYLPKNNTLDELVNYLLACAVKKAG